MCAAVRDDGAIFPLITLMYRPAAHLHMMARSVLVICHRITITFPFLHHCSRVLLMANIGPCIHAHQRNTWPAIYFVWTVVISKTIGKRLLANHPRLFHFDAINSFADFFFWFERAMSNIYIDSICFILLAFCLRLLLIFIYKKVEHKVTERVPCAFRIMLMNMWNNWDSFSKKYFEHIGKFDREC